MAETKWTPNDLREQKHRGNMEQAKKLFAPGMLVEWTVSTAKYSGGKARFVPVVHQGRVNKVADIVEIRLANGDYRYVHVLDLRVAEEGK